MWLKPNAAIPFVVNVTKKKYTAIDLFCGAGGLTVGLSDAGFQVLAGVENKAVAAETYRSNNPKSKIYECDIRSISVTQMLEDLGLKRGELDLLAGCPPCQGFSSHRTRNKSPSAMDERNNLVLEFMRFVKIIWPKTIMLENVPALAKDWRIQSMKAQLIRLGYVVEGSFIQIKDAADYGVPQRRKRLLIKASRYGVIPNAVPDKTRKTVKDAIASLLPAGKSGDYLHDMPEKRSEKVKNIISLVPKDGGSRSDIPRKFWLDCHKNNGGGYKDVYGRMSWNDVAPTITGGCNNPSKGRFIHPEENRAITLREAALLQTFPLKYKFSVERGKEAIALMIGNALPPEFIRRHAIEYRKHLKKACHE